MSNEEKDMRCRIHRLEDNLLRCKDFQEKLRIHYVLYRYRKQLQTIMFKNEEA